MTNFHKYVLQGPLYTLTNAEKANITFLSDLIGVLTHIGPHDLASKTSKTKLCKVLIQDLE
jgi:hypothetical protein